MKRLNSSLDIEFQKIFQVVVDNNSTNAIVVLDIQNPDYKYTNVSQTSILSYIQYCNKYNIDLILHKGICQKYRIVQLEQRLHNYYAKIVPQLFKANELFQWYDLIGVRFENDMIITPNAPNYFELCNNKFLSYQLFTDIKWEIQFNKLQYLTNDEVKISSIFNKVFNDMKKIFKLSEDYKTTSGIKIYSKDWVNIFQLSQFQKFLKIAHAFRPNQMYIQDHFINFNIIKLFEKEKVDVSNFLYKNEEILDKIRILLNPINYPNSVLESCINDKVQIIHCGGGGITPVNQKIRKDRLNYFYKEYYG